ncbi:hypothetical protein Tco_1197800, partial [Tanacetum coccineum]
MCGEGPFLTTTHSNKEISTGGILVLIEVELSLGCGFRIYQYKILSILSMGKQNCLRMKDCFGENYGCSPLRHSDQINENGGAAPAGESASKRGKVWESLAPLLLRLESPALKDVQGASKKSGVSKKPVPKKGHMVVKPPLSSTLK